VTNLLPDTASERAQELLNGQSFGVASEYVYSEAGDYLVGVVLARRERSINKDTKIAVLIVRAAEGQSEGEALEAGQRVTVRCAPRQLRDMIAQFDPQPGDEVAILLHAPTTARGQKPFSYSVTKAKVAESGGPW
jgi:hypothetical protein